MGKLLPAVRKHIEVAQEIPDDMKDKYPRLHFCEDWDFMLINDDDPEFEVCNCFYRDGRHWVNEEEQEEQEISFDE